MLLSQRFDVLHLKGEFGIKTYLAELIEGVLTLDGARFKFRPLQKIKYKIK